MGFIIFAAFTVAVIVVTTIVTNRIKRFYKNQIELNRNDTYKVKDNTFRYGVTNIIRWTIIVAIAVPFAVITVFRTFHVVENGHIGIVKQFGSIVGTTGEGLVTTAPWQSLDPVSVKTERLTYSMTGDPGGNSIGSAVSKDSQTIDLVVILNYQVQRSGVVELYRKTGGDYVNRIIDPAVPQEVKAVTAQFKAIEFAANRETIRTRAEKALGEALSLDSIVVNNISFANVGFTQEFNNAIEETQVAEQNAKREEARVRVATAQANQAIEKARGEADSQIIKAKGSAQSIELEGRALRNNPEVIKLRAIEKLNPSVKTVLLPSDSNFILPGDVISGK